MHNAVFKPKVEITRNKENNAERDKREKSIQITQICGIVEKHFTHHNAKKCDGELPCTC